MALLGLYGEVSFFREWPEAVALDGNRLVFGAQNSLDLPNQAYWSGDRVALICNRGVPLIQPGSPFAPCPTGHSFYADGVFTVGPATAARTASGWQMYAVPGNRPFYETTSATPTQKVVYAYIHRDPLDNITFFSDRQEALNGAGSSYLPISRLDTGSLFVIPAPSGQYTDLLIQHILQQLSAVDFSSGIGELVADAFLSVETRGEIQRQLDIIGDIESGWKHVADLTSWVFETNTDLLDHNAIGQRFGESAKGMVRGSGSLNAILRKRGEVKSIDGHSMLKLALLTEVGSKAHARFRIASPQLSQSNECAGDQDAIYYSAPILLSKTTVDTSVSEIITVTAEFVATGKISIISDSTIRLSVPTPDIPSDFEVCVVPSAESVDEGQEVLINISVSDPSVTELYWSIELTDGMTNSEDFNTPIFGTAKLFNGFGLIRVIPKENLTTDGERGFIVYVRAGSPFGELVAQSIPVVINDTSTAPEPPDPTYQITPSASSVDEGSSVTFTVTTENFGTGLLYWSILPAGGSLDANDFSTAMSGPVVVNNDQAEIVISTSADLRTEGAEAFSVQLREGAANGPILATSTLVTINDTSLTPPPPAPTYSISPSATSINEGSSVTFTVRTTDFADGALYWTINQVEGTINSSDFSTAMSGQVQIVNNIGSFTVTTLADLVTEGVERFRARLRTGSTSGTVVASSVAVRILDTSVTPPPVVPTYAISASDISVNEGGSLTFTVTTTDVGNATLYWAIRAISGTVNTGDFSTALSGSVVVVNNSGGFTVTTVADAATEGLEVFVVDLKTGSTSGTTVATSQQVAIQDTSLTPPPPDPLYSITASAASVNEGETITFAVATQNTSAGTLYWTVHAVSGALTSADFSTPMSGAVSIVNNAGSIPVQIRADSTTEGSESFLVRLRTGSTSGTVVATSSTVLINDTSLTPPPTTTEFSESILFLDTFNVESRSNVEISIKQPDYRGKVFTYDRPWEGNISQYVSLFKDGNIFSMYYRGFAQNTPAPRNATTCYAVSNDGINWTRPNLGLFNWEGASNTNIVRVSPNEHEAHNFSPFLDSNPAAAANAKYKAVARFRYPDRTDVLNVWRSGDGKNWSLYPSGNPVFGIGEGGYDSHNLAFWDDEIGKYRIYFRKIVNNRRDISTSISTDFVTWDKPSTDLKYTDSEAKVSLYTNGVVKYPRAKKLYVGFPVRFEPYPDRRLTGTIQITSGNVVGVGTKFLEELASFAEIYIINASGQRIKFTTRSFDQPGVTNTAMKVTPNNINIPAGTAYYVTSQSGGTTNAFFMSSRDGVTFTRTSTPIIPGDSRYDRDTYAENGLLFLASEPDKMSVYATKGGFSKFPLLARNTPKELHRYSYRLDGFGSLIAANGQQGQFTTKLFKLENDLISLNARTNATGGFVTVEILNPSNVVIPGFAASDFNSFSGDNVEYRMRWARQLSELKNTNIKLRFTVRSAEVFAISFFNFA